jgi:hypothetical protein
MGFTLRRTTPFHFLTVPENALDNGPDTAPGSTTDGRA